MRWFRFLPLLVVLLFDFVTLDAPLFQPGPRTVQVDDEEESAPRRPIRLRRTVSSLTAALPAHRYVVPPPVRRLSDPTARTARRSDPPPWLGPITRVRFASAGSASPPEDH
jgi:hypothetical protein